MSEAGWSLVASSRGPEVTLKKYGTNGRSHVAVVHLSVLVGVWAWVMEPVKGKVQKGDNSQVDPFGQKMCPYLNNSPPSVVGGMGIKLKQTKQAERTFNQAQTAFSIYRTPSPSFGAAHGRSATDSAEARLARP